MEIIYTREALTRFRENCKNLNKTIGFVPTMGALHMGHISLVQQAKKNVDYTIASIFVNPTQFNNKEDFNNYPLTIDQDIKLLIQYGCDAVFIPSVEEIYGQKGYHPFTIPLGKLGNIFEGEKRPGHFDGVIEILSILFQLLKPEQVYMGLKDYQQVMVVEKLLKHIGFPIQLIKCATIRDEDGLAVSSRNKRLSPNERQIALNLYKALSEIKENYQKSEISILKKSYFNRLNKIEEIQVEYIDIVDSQTLKPLKSWNPIGKNIVLIAAFVGKVRLIDNLLF
ncbi:MAG: pantoate--beta-alanine ligase [Chitinophagales bacterium]|nr:pantoate--beta-alanine ligase [Chitinophagales bacterium]